MLNKEIFNKIVDLCHQEQLENVGIYYKRIKTTFVNVVKQDIETFKVSDNEGMNISGHVNGFYNETYVETFDDQTLLNAIGYLKETAEINQNEGNRTIQVDTLRPERNLEGFQEADIHLVVRKLQEIQKEAILLDERVDSVPRSSYYEHYSKIILVNDNGEMIEDEYGYVTGNISVIAKENDIMKDSEKFIYKKNYFQLDYDDLLEKAVNEAVGRFGAKPVKTGTYKVMLKNTVAAEIFCAMMPVFYMSSVRKGSSQMQDQIEKSIAVEEFQLIEDPGYKRGASYRRFDDEGTITERKHLVKDGILKVLLTRQEDQPKSLSGNAYRYSYKDTITTAFSNCYISKGKKTTEQLLEKAGDCMVIENVDGLHAGINLETGNFSLIANGYFNQEGLGVQPVEQITVSGNFYKLLKNIVTLSSDVESVLYGNTLFESPSILVNELLIGGL